MDISSEIIGVAVRVGRIGNFGGEIMESRGEHLKGNHRSSYKSRWDR